MPPPLLCAPSEQGSLPLELTRWVSLATLDLSNNQLSSVMAAQLTCHLWQLREMR